MGLTVSRKTTKTFLAIWRNKFQPLVAKFSSTHKGRELTVSR